MGPQQLRDLWHANVTLATSMLVGTLAEVYAWLPLWILRGFVLFFGLIWSLYDYARANGNTHLLISAVTQRLGLYERKQPYRDPAVSAREGAPAPRQVKP